MPIHQRCQSCRSFFSFDAKQCPSCGAAVKQRIGYVIKYHNGKRHKKRLPEGATKFESQIFEAEWNPVESAQQSETITISVMKDRYIRKLQNENKPYWQKVGLFFDRMILAWGNIPILEITPTMIRVLQSQIRQHCSSAYTDRHVAIWKAAFSFVTDAPNPFKKVRLYKADNSLVRYLTDAEEAALLTAAQGSFLFPIITVGLNTGLRIMDVFHLNVNNVDMENRWITPERRTKGRPPVPMNDAVVTVLNQVKPDQTGYYFINPMTGRPYTNARGTWKRIKREAGIDRPFRLHDLRHSFAIRAGRAGVDLRIIQRLLGHSSPDITIKRYAQVIDDELHAAVDKLTAPKTDPGK